MAITVRCSCGTRVRAEEARLRRGPPCPECGARLTARPEPAEARIPFRCLCGLSMTFPASRGGLWFDCPECGRKTVIPGYGSSRRAPPPRALPVDESTRIRRPVALIVSLLAVAAAVAAAVVWLL